MKTIFNRLLLISWLLLAGWTLGQAQNTVTLNLSLRSPADAAANKGTLDGMVFYSGNDFGDQIIYPLFGGTGTKSFQISSPGENITKTVTSSDYFNIRPTTNGYVIDKTKIMNFSGSVSNITGSITVTLKQLAINTYSVQETSPAPGDQITIIYQTGKGSYPNPTSFGVQLLDNSGNKIADLQNPIDTKIPDQEDFGFSVGNTNRSIKATLPSTIAAGTYKVRVVATTKSTTVNGGPSAPFTIKAASPPTTTPTSINPTTVCPGGQLTLSADVIDDGLLAVRETAGGGGRYYVAYYNASTNQQVLDVQNYNEVYVGTPTIRAAGQYTANNKISGPMTIPSANELPPGRYYCKIFVGVRDTDPPVRLNPNTAGNTLVFTVSAPPTAVISDSKPNINAGEVAVVKIKFGGDGPWSFNYDMLNGSNYTKVDETLTEISAFVNPSSDYLFDASKLLNFRNRVCSGTVSGFSQIRVSKLTVTTGAVTPSPACPNVDALKVAYSVNGVAPAGTKFYAQIKDKDGNYQTIGEGTSTPITCGIGRPISAFPVAIGGTDYAVRVISADGSIQASSVTTTVKLTRPNAPAVPSPEYCQNNPVASIKVDGDIMYYGIYKDVRDDAHRTAYNSKTPPPPPTTVGTYYYELVQFDSRGCESIGIDMIVKVKDSASPPGDATIEYCKGASATPLTTGASSPVWYNNNSTTPLGGAPTPPTDNVTTLVYKVAQGGNCPSGQSTVTVKIKPVPDPPTVNAPAAVCQFADAPALSANSSGTLNWFGPSGNALPGAPKPNTQNEGSVTYSVSQNVNGCESAGKTPVTQVVKKASDLPTVGSASILYCRSQMPTSLTAVGENLKWYDASDNPITDIIPKTTTIGTTVYKFRQTTGSNGCPSASASLTVSVQDAPGAPAVTAIPACVGIDLPASVLLSGVTGNNSYSWYTSATGGAASQAPPVVSTAAPGPQSVFVTQRAGNCEGPRAELKITVSAIPAAPVATDPAPLCQYQVVSASSFTAVGDKLQWYANGQTTATAQPAITNTSLPTTFTVAVTQTVNTCVSPAKVITQTVNPAPPLPTGTSLQLCLNDAAKPLSATALPGNTLTWYGMNDMGGTPSATAPVITAGSVRTETYYFTQTDGTTKCESKRQSVVAKIDTKPGAPTVTASQFACLNTTPVALSATATNPLVWSSPLISTTSTTAPTPPTNTVTTTPYRYTVVQVLGSCVSDANFIDYSVRALPAAPTLQSPQVACVGQPALALTAAGQNLKWYKDAALTTALTPSVPTTQSLSETWYVTQTDANGCRSATATPLEVRIRAQATATVSGDDRITAYDSTAIRIKLGGDGPWTMTLWDGTTVNKTLKNPYIKWERPLTTRTYSITTLSNDCGIGVASNTYTLIVDKPLGVEPLTPATLSMTVSPNPTTGVLTVEWSAVKRQAVQLRFLSAAGAVVWQVDRVGTGTIQTETLLVGDRPAGIYFLQLQSDSSGLLVRKLVKQ